jgi:hypothetical protein
MGQKCLGNLQITAEPLCDTATGPLLSPGTYLGLMRRLGASQAQGIAVSESA